MTSSTNQEPEHEAQRDHGTGPHAEPSPPQVGRRAAWSAESGKCSMGCTRQSWFMLG